MEVLHQIAQTKIELDAMRPLAQEVEDRVMQKLRIDWNFHSNHLEGNSLTRGETITYLLHGLTASGKPMKDHLEISGHNQAIDLLFDIVKENRPLTESFIRELHKLILHEPYWSNAITPDGQQTKKRIKVGAYKTSPNHVLTATGEAFYFATPEETPAKMQELLEWYRSEKENAETVPALLAATFHYRFICIHPFDDGNGRIARLLMNLILISYGFPPAIVRTTDKENYFRALQQADGGILEPFITYIAEQLQRSLHIMLRAAQGESIEEDDDVDKEIALLKQEFKGNEKYIKIIKSDSSVKNVFDLNHKRILQRIKASLRKFNEFYLETLWSCAQSDNSIFKQGSMIIVNKSTQLVKYHLVFKGLKKENHLTKNTAFEFDLVFEHSKYLFMLSTIPEGCIEKYYHESLSDEEINRVCNQADKKHLETLKGILHNDKE